MSGRRVFFEILHVVASGLAAISIVGVVVTLCFAVGG
jgi:hypothetical protein